ncbi:hypothetical protein JX266_004773 [Neoarthrinium moseri]|nr:hypothetical protein JX266_004773 [Neoarthrinium moseri]
MAAPDPFGTIVNAITLAQLLKTTIITFVEAEKTERSLVAQLHLNASTLDRFVATFRRVEGAGLSRDDQSAVAEACNLLEPEILSMKEACAKIHARDSRFGKYILRAAWVTYRRRQIEALTVQMKQWSDTFGDFIAGLPKHVRDRLETDENRAEIYASADHMRALSNLFASLATSAASDEAHRLKRQADEVEIIGTSGSLRSATYKGSRVLVEYKTYRQGESDERITYIADQIGRLVNFLERADPITTGILACAGWTEIPQLDRFGIIFKMPLGYRFFPDSPNRSGGLATLKSIIAEGAPAASDPTKRTYSPKHTLNDRMEVASTIATALFYLHSYNWVHEGVSTSNIIMLADDDGEEVNNSPSNKEYLGRPFLVGFDGARSNDGMTSIGGIEEIGTDENRFTENIYRHPDRQGETAEDRLRYQMCHDQYSLGAVLLEIGIWMPLEKEPSVRRLRQQDFGSARERHLAVRQALIKLAERRLGITFGQRYQDIVLKCLTIKSSASYELSGLLYDVVEPLSSMRSSLSEV